MTATAPSTPPAPAATADHGLIAWLDSAAPASRWQAACGQMWWRWRLLVANRLALLGLVIVLGLLAVALLAPWLAPHPPLAGDLSLRLQPPSSTYWLGTDDQGRDILSRLIAGSRTTLYVVAVAAVLSAPLGVLIGAVSGYAGGWLDAVLMRLTDIFLAFPRLILALAFVAALGPGLDNAVIAIAITAWPPYARLARAESLALRRSDFIAASRLLGASHTRLVLGHVLPLCLPSVLIRVTLDMAGMILAAAGLGFLGLGAQPPLPEWGAMIAAGRQFLLGAWWVAAAPGAAIFIVSLGFNLLGDGLRDALDPRAQQRG
ncbi:ABC transporter permease [Amphibiibacter pelophylacis]|uniref:ABC transporter permease n=1 Tax=Amphibiibacter pelophylacis TaxID=1799477 RepID=A0ACC6P3W3_9BURK